jgi:hypothetical protein
VDNLQFLHYKIDVRLCQVTTPDNKSVTVCQVDSNVPILMWHEEKGAIEENGIGDAYSLGRALDMHDSLYLDIEPFALIIKRCCENICLCVMCPNDLDESIYHIKRLEHGQVVSDELPRAVVGHVSKGSRHEFDLLVGSPTQAFRIETLPTIDGVLGPSQIVFCEKGDTHDYR